MQGALRLDRTGAQVEMKSREIAASDDNDRRKMYRIVKEVNTPDQRADFLLESEFVAQHPTQTETREV